MPEERQELHLLLKVLKDLEDFLPYLILVGGWVPYLYSKYLWKGVRHEPLTTVDIDWGFKDVPFRGPETISERVRKKHYGEHHASMDRLNPFVPVVRLEKEDLKADVEFITAPETSEKVKENLVGKEIKINEIEDFDILLESPVKVNVQKIEVILANPAIFTFHKLLTFNRRGRPDKLQKDLYYAYYVLFFHPEKEKLTREISTLINKLKQGKQVRKNIEQYFEDPYAKGPSLIAAATGGSPITTLVPSVREDAFERISELLTP